MAAIEDDTDPLQADLVRVLDRFYPGISDIESLMDEPEQGLPKLELQLQRRIQRQFKAIFTSYPFQIGLPLAFAVLNELELQDLTVLIEAKSAQMPADRFTPYLLMSTQISSSVNARGVLNMDASFFENGSTSFPLII